MQLRVLHVLDHSLPVQSGYTFRTAALLRAQHEFGIDTVLLTGPRQSTDGAGAMSLASERFDDLVFHRTAWTRSPRAWPVLSEWQEMRATQGRIEELIRTHRPHIVHAHSPVLNAIPAIRAGRKLGVPVAYEIRSFWEDAAVDHGTTTEGSLRYRATKAVETYASKRADHVFTICEGLRGDLMARGIPESRITVVPNGADVQTAPVAREADPALQARFGLKGCTVLGFVGSFYGYEGLNLLVDALPELTRHRPELRVLLVGGGPCEGELKAQVERLGLQEVVKFAGRVPHSQVDSYYDLIDLLVYPRRPMRLTELVTPLKPLECMAQGRVLLASDVGGHRELIADGRTGFLFKAGDVNALVSRVLAVLGQRDAWPQVQRQGWDFVKNERNWRESGLRHVEAYRRLVPAWAGEPIGQPGIAGARAT